MTSALQLPAPAKLNLFLHIVGQRPDGYHELQTLFQMLNWSDTLSFETQSSPELTFSCSDPALETADNLVVRAVRAVEAHTGQTLPVRIHLNKQLPMGGGLGGGSSDGATTLLGLNRLFDLKLSETTLLALAATLGADVPVFVAGHSAWAEGIGDLLTPVALPNQWFVIIHPGIHISTAQLFTHPQLTRNTPVSRISTDMIRSGHNDFEPLVRRLYPDIEQIFQLCQPFGETRLTGTGACLFLARPDQSSAEDVQRQLKDILSGSSVYVARGESRSSAHRQLSGHC